MERIIDLKPDNMAEVVTDLVISEITEGETKRKTSFFRMKLSDRTGTINAVCWDGELFRKKGIRNLDVVKVKALVGSYNMETQLNITNIKVLPEGKYNPEDFVKVSKRNPEEMMIKVIKIIGKIENEYLKELLELTLLSCYKREFSISPGAKGMHHNYMYGLLEHTLGVATICVKVMGEYGVNMDLLVTAALLHDLGKIYEYSSDMSIEMTKEGRLLGHIVMTDEIVCKAMNVIDGFPEELRLQLRHILLSHHGKYEHGSPKIPQTREAVALNMADDMDAKMATVNRILSEDKSESEWTPFDRMSSRYYYKGEVE